MALLSAGVHRWDAMRYPGEADKYNANDAIYHARTMAASRGIESS